MRTSHWAILIFLFREGSYEVVPEKVEPVDTEPAPLDANFFNLNFIYPKDGCLNRFVFDLCLSDKLYQSVSNLIHNLRLIHTIRPSLEKNKKCANECKINVGDLMTLKLEPQGLGAAIKNFNEYFT